jgi:formate C-acetyltransferase
VINLVTERTKRLKEKMRVQPRLCVERAYWMTVSYKESEGQPPIIRRALALRKILENLPITIDDEELIVGKSTSKIRGIIMLPELRWDAFPEDMDPSLTDDEKVKIREIHQYWRGKSAYEMWRASVPTEIFEVISKHQVAITTAAATPDNKVHVAPDFEMVLTKGLVGIRKEIDEETSKLDLTKPSDFEKYLFLKAASIALDAVVHFANRYSELAKHMAAKEINPKRKAELEKIAEICSRVPANPSDSFHEALQSIWLIFIALRNEAMGTGISFGRADQYLYPFYKKDIEEGRITREEAKELIAQLLIKANDATVATVNIAAAAESGFPSWWNITLGGITPEGKDAVNDLSYLFLEAESEVAMSQEEIVIRVNKKNPDSFLIKALEVAKKLSGKFKFISDDTTIQQLIRDGIPIEDARDFIIVGCILPTVPGKSCDNAASGINLGLCLELALNDGVSRLTGEQIGPKTGDPKKFKTYEEVLEAYKKQVEFVIPAVIAARNIDMKICSEYFPYPLMSALTRDCIKRGLHTFAGGALYASDAHGFIGIINVADSLAAIKKVVLEKGKISMEEIIDALDKNFEGYEHTLYLLKRAPKFGNDDDFVDSIVQEIIDHVSATVRRYQGFANVKNVAAALTATLNIPFGKIVGALPEGRKACEPLAEGGISPHQGRNVTGPVATFKSVSKLDLTKLRGAVLNIKFNPEALKDEAKIKKLCSMIRTYCESGGHHVQFNIVGTDILRDAQRHPEKYRDLLVRVATYSAYFVELGRDIQDDIIARMEFGDIV